MVPLTKQLADLLTAIRALLTPLLLWLGITKGSMALPAAVILMLFDWTADSIDGVLARKNPYPHQTWIGDRDLEIDMFVSVGLMGYMVISGFLVWQVVTLYMIVWFVFFALKGVSRSWGMLFQAPIYGWFIYTALREVPQFGLWIGAWLVAAIVVTWPKFPKEIVPDFLHGLVNALQRNREDSD